MAGLIKSLAFDEGGQSQSHGCKTNRLSLINLCKTRDCVQTTSYTTAQKKRKQKENECDFYFKNLIFPQATGSGPGWTISTIHFKCDNILTWTKRKFSGMVFPYLIGYAYHSYFLQNTKILTVLQGVNLESSLESYNYTILLHLLIRNHKIQIFRAMNS